MDDDIEIFVFQSPSLRGSGRFSRSLPESERACPFQSPSLRGSGRFDLRTDADQTLFFCFNPLHCGAVVASGGMPAARCGPLVEFQSPSLRGSGRFRRA